MDNIKQGFYALVMAIMATVAMTACSADTEMLEEDAVERMEETESAGGMNTCRLIFEGGIETFDGAGTRAAAWKDGETVFLVFSTGATIAEGKAVYSSATGEWTLYYGVLPATTSALCKAYNFSGEFTVDGANVALTPCTAVYADEAATYSKEGRVVKVKATLKPITGRLRFKGTAGTEFDLTGVDCHASYGNGTGTFTPNNAPIKLTVGADGYTPYVYGTITSSDREIGVVYEDLAFATICETGVLAVGKSGFMELPTAEWHNGWDETAVIDGDYIRLTVGGVSFTMKYVEGGTFTMGATSEQGSDADSDEKPTHQVTLSDYYIGQTEVTQELWTAVMGSNPSYFSGTNLPVENVSWNDCQTFITKLSTLTGMTFSLPTEAQWEYAARGGNKSKGYKYSGSNTIGGVAWYTSNSSSKTHSVATKQPNELGLYDMSGNVWEWCNDWYASSYSSTAAVNPTGPTTGSYRVLRGGSWYSNATSCRVSSRNYITPSDTSSDLGLRLALSSGSY